MFDKVKSFFTARSRSSKIKNFDGMYSSASAYYGNNGNRLTPSQALIYYSDIAPLFTGIDMISSELGSIDIAIKDTTAGEYVFDHPLITLLNNPSAFSSGREFLEQLASFYLITGNVFVVATGPVNRPPLELQVINPSCVQLEAGPDGYLEEVIVTSSTTANSRRFKRKEVGGRFRYYAGAEAEIWHIKSFNSKVYAGELWGMSPLTPIMNELEQYVESAVHNLSLLKRGTRPSGALKFNDNLTDEQFQRYQQQVDSFYSGGRNAGRLLLLENADFQEMGQSNKDMDFVNLTKSITNTIYSSLRIPLPLINAEFSTYDNLATSKVNFYDNAVLPLLKRLLEELTAFLMFRFKSDALISSFDPESIEPLEGRRIEKAAKLQAAGILTTNELRNIIGYEPVVGGDTILIDFNKTPLQDSLDSSNSDQLKALLSKNGLD